MAARAQACVVPNDLFIWKRCVNGVFEMCRGVRARRHSPTFGVSPSRDNGPPWPLHTNDGDGSLRSGPHRAGTRWWSTAGVCARSRRCRSRPSSARKGLPPTDVAGVATDLLITAALLERRFRSELRKGPLNDLDVARLLLVLGSHNGLLRPIDLVDLLAVSSATVTRILDRAEAAGLVDRSYISVDRRITLCVMTRRGDEARTDVLRVLRSAAAPLLGTNQIALGEALAAARATWRGRPAGSGIRMFREAKFSYDLTA